MGSKITARQKERMEVPKKRQRNTLHLAQERGEMLKPQRFTSTKFKDPRNSREWEEEDWGNE